MQRAVILTMKPWIKKQRWHLLLLCLIAFISSSCTTSDPIASWYMINVDFGTRQGDANLLVIGDRVLMIDAGYYKKPNRPLSRI